MNDNTLDTLIQMDTHYTRSINLERDADSSDVLSAYIPTSRAQQTLTQITDTFHQESYPRSWALIGPYGSGKSSFGAFLGHLLENKNTKNSRLAKEILQKYHPALAHKINDNIHVLMSLLYRPIIVDKGKTYKLENYDGDKVLERAEVFKQLPITYWFGCSSFFLSISHEFLNNIKNSLELKMWIEKKIQPLRRILPSFLLPKPPQDITSNLLTNFVEKTSRSSTD